MTYEPEIWYLHKNDLVGGWSIMNVDKPPSQTDFRKGEIEIAMVLREEDAREMVGSHNFFQFQKAGWL